ncbi:LysR substrate-binding domain-containing protein [Spirillospora sp. NPDC050679]
MELRDIEIFLVLAEELHFGRTAERLRLSTARVSQSIAKQERQIGGALFDRTSRRVELTTVGERLYADLKPAYQRILSVTRSAAEAVRGVHGTLTVGTMGALAHVLTDTVKVFRERYPAAGVTFVEIQPIAPFTQLRAGEVDVALLWLPVREPDLTVGPVLSARPIVLMAAVGHPLAQRDSVRMEDLGDYLVPQPRHPMPEYHEEGLVPFHTPAGRPIRRGPKISTWQETLILVGAGDAVQPIQAEAADFYPWPGLAFIPIEDAPIGRWALVWRTDAATTLLQAFVAVAEQGAKAGGAEETSGPQ